MEAHCAPASALIPSVGQRSRLRFPGKTGLLEPYGIAGARSEPENLTRGFAVYTEREGGTINHGLTTALIDRDGKIVKLWRGNAWTTDEAIAALHAVTRP